MAVQVFKGGVPTEPDVRLLLDKYGVPEEGTVMSYSEIELLLKIARRTPRWVAVTNRWRRHLLRHHNLVVGPINGQAFKVLSPAERISVGKTKINSGMRQVKRGYIVVEQTDRTRLSSEMAAEQDHLKQYSLAMFEAAKRISAQNKHKPMLPGSSPSSNP